MKPIKVLIMSVGEYEGNKTVNYFEMLGGIEHCTVCLPMQYACNSQSYQCKGIDVFLYDEKKYINEDFEYFGFKRRNCGGVGRQGIAEAVEKYGDDFLCFQLDDDICGISISNFALRQSTTIKKWEHLEKLIRVEDEWYQKLGIECMARTGATLYGLGETGFVANRKIFNNFIMRKGNELNYFGFAALCSDDQRFNIYNNLLNRTPMISHFLASIRFENNQGDRKDGNAPLYNSDCSWKKSFALKMMAPWAIKQTIRKETNRVLFREFIEASKLFPPICIEKDGKIIGQLR